MAIKNPDGSEYRPSGSLTQYDPENVELDLFNLWDQEAIEYGGSPILYFDVFVNVDSIDELLMEARDKIYSQHGVKLYTYYEPSMNRGSLGLFGVDSNQEEVMFEFNLQHVRDTLGFVPKIGARLHTPHRKEDWIIVNRNVATFQMWGKLRLQLLCHRFRENRTTGGGQVTNKPIDYKINEIKTVDRGME